jgi:hypothetical protein
MAFFLPVQVGGLPRWVSFSDEDYSFIIPIIIDSNDGEKGTVIPVPQDQKLGRLFNRNWYHPVLFRIAC